MAWKPECIFLAILADIALTVILNHPSRGIHTIFNNPCTFSKCTYSYLSICRYFQTNKDTSPERDKFDLKKFPTGKKIYKNLGKTTKVTCYPGFTLACCKEIKKK